MFISFRVAGLPIEEFYDFYSSLCVIKVVTEVGRDE
jgi:hypothetical protein